MLFDVLSVRRARARYMVVLDETMNFLLSVKIPLCQGDGWSYPAKSSWNKGRWWIGNISWRVCRVVLVGWTQQFDQYAFSRLFDVRWFLRTWCYVCVFCFPITISVTCSLLFGILFWEAADHFCSWFWGWSRELCSQDGADIGWCICIGSVNKYNVLFDIVGHSTWPKENTPLTDDEEDVCAVVPKGKRTMGCPIDYT